MDRVAKQVRNGVTGVTLSTEVGGMSRGLRLLGAVALACASVPLAGVGVAHADTSVKNPTNSAYFYAQGVDKPDESPAAPPNVGAETDGVSPGNLAVASKGGSEDKVSFLYFDMFDLDPSAVISKAVVRMTTVDNPPSDLSFQASPDKVVACKAGDQGFNGDDGAGLAKNAPGRLCDLFSAPAKASADGKAYEFDITALAASWLTGANDGVAFTTSESAKSSNFQVVFDKAETATLDLTYAVPGAVTAPPPVVSGPVVAPPPTDTGFTPTDSGFAPAPTTDFGAPSVSEPLVPAAPNPAPQEAPVAAAPQAAPALAPVALREASMRPGTTFWLVGLLGAGALALLSLVMGDPSVPAAASRRSRLSKALAARQSASSSASSASSSFRARPV